MKPQIVIEIRGGNIITLSSNVDLDYVVVDYDNINTGEYGIELCPPDYISDDPAIAIDDEALAFDVRQLLQ
jgi:hypothetical protein